MTTTYTQTTEGRIYDLSADLLWEIAGIEAMQEIAGYATLTAAEVAKLRTYAATCNDDARYPGILECAFENARQAAGL